MADKHYIVAGVVDEESDILMIPTQEGGDGPHSGGFQMNILQKNRPKGILFGMFFFLLNPFDITMKFAKSQ